MGRQASGAPWELGGVGPRRSGVQFDLEQEVLPADGVVDFDHGQRQGTGPRPAGQGAGVGGPAVAGQPAQVVQYPDLHQFIRIEGLSPFG
jgi:hypothetical protein